MRRAFNRCGWMLAACWLLTHVSQVQAQILNVEKKRLEQDLSEYLTGNVGLHFNYTNRSRTLAQPARVLNTGVTAHLGYVAGGHLHMLINQYQLHRINDNAIVNTGFSHLRTQFHHRDMLSYELYAQFQYDRPRGMAFRWLVGGGPRLRLLQRDAINLSMGTGLMYEMENWHPPAAPHDPLVRARYVKSSSYLSTRVDLNDHVDFNAVAYYQVGYDRELGAALQRVSVDLNLIVKLTQRWSLTSSFSASYETRPIVAIIPFVFATTNGVQFEF